MNQKSLDKKKAKEWEKTFYDNFCSIERNPYSNETFYIVDGNERNPEKYLKFIQSLLTQQRTELLEEILEENFCDLDGTYDYDGIAQSVIDLHKKL